jgi:hypothetical protein
MPSPAVESGASTSDHPTRSSSSNARNALAAARNGRSVVLAEPTHRIGGMATCGLSHTDFRTFESLTGAFHEFTRRVEAHYVRHYGADSPEVKHSFRGTQPCQRWEQKRGEKNKNSFHGLISKLLTGITASSL